MKHIKKIILLLLSVAFFIFAGLMCVGNFASLLDYYGLIGQVIVQSVSSLLEGSVDVLTIISLVFILALVVLPIVGIVISFVKIKKHTKRNPLDFFTMLFMSLGILTLSTIPTTSTGYELVVRIVALSTMGLLVIYQALLLFQIKPIVKVETSTPKEEVKEESEPLPVEEEKVEKEVIEEINLENEEVKEEPTLLGKTFTVFDGKQNLKVMIVGVGEVEIEPVYQEVTPIVQQAPVSQANPVAPSSVSSNEEENEESEEVNEKGEKVPSLTYQERLEQLEPEIKEMYSSLKNELLKHRKVHARISKSCETFRVGYDIIAKIVVAGKSLKLYLAMDPFAVDSAIYHQRDASSKKRFVEVPLVVKVKSALGLKKACQLIDLTCEKKEILPKSRYTEVDYSQLEVNQ